MLHAGNLRRRHVTAVGAAFVALAVGAVAHGATVSREVEARLARRARVPVIAIFRAPEAAPALAGRDARTAFVLGLRQAMARSRAVFERDLGRVARGVQPRELWICNALALEGDRALVAALARHPDVRRVIYDRPVAPPATSAAPRSPSDRPTCTWGLLKLGVDRIRDRFKLDGKGVRLGHLDTGVDATHPDLAGKIERYRDFIGGPAQPGDPMGHGTHTAGTMVGGAASGQAIGVAPGATLLVGRVLGDDAPSSGILAGMQWLLDPDGVAATDDAPRAVCCSWHTDGDEEPFYQAIEAWERAGVVPVFAAGNKGAVGVGRPSEHPATLAVGAVKADDWVAPFSAHGPGSFHGQQTRKPDFLAPGTQVTSAKAGGGYEPRSGTSMAAPHVAGLIALLAQADPNVTNQQIRAVLTSTTVEVGAPGWDPPSGYGRVDGLRAVESLVRARSFRGLHR